MTPTIPPLPLCFSNATFAGLPAHQYRRLQSVLNAAARLIYRRRRFDHVTPLLRDFHWLKVPESRVAYKLAVTVYRCLHGMAPPYLCDGLQRVAELNRSPLRSSMSNALVVPSTRLKATNPKPRLKAKITATSYTTGRSQVSRGNSVSQGQTEEA